MPHHPDTSLHPSLARPQAPNPADPETPDAPPSPPPRPIPPPPYYSSATQPFIIAGTLPTMIGVQAVPSGQPDCQVIGTAAPCGWLPTERESRAWRARRESRESRERMAGRATTPAGRRDGGPAGLMDDRPSVDGAEQVWRISVRGVELDGGWVLRGGVYIELGEAAEWERGWVAEPAGRSGRRW